jgi:carbonic anhydrase-like protein
MLWGMSDAPPGGRWRSSLPFTAERIGAVAIYCSDGRYNEQFDEFLHTRLQLPRYDRLVIPGGAAALAGHFASYREEEALNDQLRFLATHHALDRAVLIAHRGCGYYLKRLMVSESDLAARQAEDLAKAAERIRDSSPRLRIEAYIASVEDSRVQVDSVPI